MPIQMDTEYSNKEMVFISLGEYVTTKARSVQAWTEHEPFMTISSNLDEPPEDADCFWCKDYSENEGVGEWLTKSGIASPTGRVAHCGFEQFPEFRLNRTSPAFIAATTPFEIKGE